VICEKPIAGSYCDGAKMLEVAKQEKSSFPSKFQTFSVENPKLP